MSANEKDLKSLKVYGNDDPAGSVYKVGGGDGSGNGLVLYMAKEEIDGGTLKYLTHKDGSIATWREIYDALLEELPVSCIEIYGTSPLQPTLLASQPDAPTGTYYVRCYRVVEAQYVPITEPPVFAVSVDRGGNSSMLRFTAPTTDDRLEVTQ